MSRQFATNVTTIYDIFCPVPFLPSPFGFCRFSKYLGNNSELYSNHFRAHGAILCRAQRLLQVARYASNQILSFHAPINYRCG